MNLLFFIIAMLVPWVLGYALVKPFLTQRNGYQAFAIGAGYVLGWFVATLLLRLYDYIGRPFNIHEIVLIECAIAIPLLFLKARPCPHSELVLEKTPSKLTYYLSALITLLLVYRWGLTAVDLLSKPVFPWDGWLSWSAKAKVFYYYENIPHLYGGRLPFWEPAISDTVFVGGGNRHPYFISLVQAYTALAWGGWQDGLINLPWLGVSISAASVLFGGARYLGLAFLPSILLSYFVTGFPIFDAHVSLGSYADVWVGLGLLIATYALVIAVVFNEFRMLFFSLLICIVLYVIKNSSLVFVFGLLLLMVGRFLRVAYLVALLVVSCLLVYLVESLTNIEVSRLITRVFSSYFPKEGVAYNPVGTEVLREWIVSDNWHYAFIGGGGSLLLLLGREKYKKLGQCSTLVISGLSFFVLMCLLTFMTTKFGGLFFVSYFNRVSLYFMPVFALLPFGVHNSLYSGRGRFGAPVSVL